MKAISKRLKNSITCIVLCSTVYGFSLDFFSNTVNGAATDLILGNRIEDTEVQFRGFYGIQAQIGKRLLANGIVSVKTGNIFADVRLRDIVSYANIDELSLMYRFKIESASAQASVFMGEYETPGSGIFVQRYFGTMGFASFLSEKEIAKETPSIFPLNGAGVSFMTKYSVPVAAAGYIYYNDQYGSKCLNGDVRIAGVSNAVVADFIFGVSLPFEKKDADGSSVVMVVKRAYMHTGMSFLLGGNPFANLYMQAGFSRMQTNPPDEERILELSDLYFLFEPRFAAGKTRFALSLFYFPENAYKNIPYIDKSIGAAFTIKSVPADLNSAQGIFGCVLSASMDNPATRNINIDSVSLKAVPFTEITIRNAVLNLRMPINPLKYSTPKEALSFSMSYTMRF